MNDYLITVTKPNGFAGAETVDTIRLIQVSDEYLEGFMDGVKSRYPVNFNVYKTTVT